PTLQRAESASWRHVDVSISLGRVEGVRLPATAETLEQGVPYSSQVPGHRVQVLVPGHRRHMRALPAVVVTEGARRATGVTTTAGLN
ncbi:MAG: hypothetical protein ACREBU_07810, partial [Nitrososphaera sp.]